MIRGEVSQSIPSDLVNEILSRLPTKSIMRFRCVSKLWRSVLLCPYFTELFLSRSSARPPRLLFAVRSSNGWCFFTSSQPHNPYDEKSSSLVVAADFHMKFLGETWPRLCDLVCGFIYFSPYGEDKSLVICNPSTRQYTSLPLPKGRVMNWSGFLGFDPIDKQFKVLFIDIPDRFNRKEEQDQILTLGTGNDSWRKIHCPFNHRALFDEICINGVLYYLAGRDELSFMIVCFDVRYEKFKFIYKDFISGWDDTKLINYKGKLGVITLKVDYDDLNYGGRWTSLELWVIKDVEKPESSEWSKHFSFSWDNEVVVDSYLSIVGVTVTGEIVLSTKDASKSFYVIFVNLERNTLQHVEIRGLGGTLFDNYSRVQVFTNYVEDLKFITMNDASPQEEETTSTSSKAHLQQQDRRSTFKSINKFDSLCL